MHLAGHGRHQCNRIVLALGQAGDGFGKRRVIRHGLNLWLGRNLHILEHKTDKDAIETKSHKSAMTQSHDRPKPGAP